MNRLTLSSCLIEKETISIRTFIKILIHVSIAVGNPYDNAIESEMDAQSIINSGYIPSSTGSNGDRFHMDGMTNDSLLYKPKFIPQIPQDDPNGLCNS